MHVKDIKSLGEYIGIEIIPEDWAKYYDDALDSFDKDWIAMDFNEMFDFYELDEDFRNRFLKEIEMLKKDIDLNFLVYLWYFIMYSINDKYKIERWKNQDNMFRNKGSHMMPVVSMLMGYSIHKKMMIENKYDEEQIKIHKENIRRTCNYDRERLGLDGIRFSQMVWGSRFMKGHIIQVGTLQYELKTNFFNDEDVIFVHIPRNADFSREALDYSFKNAISNVNKYLTTNNYKYVTESWLLSPELEDLLSPNSRIRNFRRYFILYRKKENINDFLNFVFNKPFINDYKELLEETSLQIKLKEKILNGEKLHIGLGILK